MSEIKSLKAGQRVKVLAGPKEPPHPFQQSIGVVQGVGHVRKNAEGSIIYKSYNVLFGNASLREVEARYLFVVGGE